MYWWRAFTGRTYVLTPQTLRSRTYTILETRTVNYHVKTGEMDGLTWRIRYDRVEESPTSPRVLRNVEGTQVHDAISNPILCSCTNDTRRLYYKKPR